MRIRQWVDDHAVEICFFVALFTLIGQKAWESREPEAVPAHFQQPYDLVLPGPPPANNQPPP